MHHVLNLLEGGHRHHGAEYLLLGDPHVIACNAGSRATSAGAPVRRTTAVDTGERGVMHNVQSGTRRAYQGSLSTHIQVPSGRRVKRIYRFFSGMYVKPLHPFLAAVRGVVYQQKPPPITLYN
jgi:hypothetical protein